MFARRIGYRPDPFFKGRQTELEQLVQGLKEKKSLQIRSVIWGMGGVGKTALAVELCHQLIAHDVFADGILWYRVRQESVAEVIKRCTIDLDIDPNVSAMTDMEARIAEFQHRLRKLDLLVVLDNADYGPEVMRPIFDLFRGIPLLITSRREFDLQGSIRVPLGDLKPEEAGALVRDLLGMSGEVPAPSSPLGSAADIDELCRSVSCLPIALVLAAAFIRERRLPIRRYIDAWRSRRDRLRLLAAERIDEKEQKLRDVRACFGISYDDLDVRTKRILAYMGLWEGRDFSLVHLASVIEETVHPPADGHDGALTAACELPGGAVGVTGGEDGRVLIWDLSNPRRPRAVLTAFQADKPIADLVVGPEGRQFQIQTDAGLIAMVPLVDVAGLRVAKAARLSPEFKERVVLVVAEDGVPVIEVQEGRLRFRLLLAWPSLASPREIPAVKASCEVMPDSGGDGSTPPVDDPAWRRKISHAWRPRQSTRPGIEVQDRLASLVMSRLGGKVPDLSEPTPRETFLLARTEHRETGPDWRMVDKAENFSEGLAAVSVLLQQRSLADQVRADDSERVRVHPLVSEFAAEQVSTDERDHAVPALSRFYLERMRSSRKHLDADQANIEFSFIWALQNWRPDQLTGGGILADVARALRYRGRYSLALQWSEHYVRAATQHGTDLQAGEAWLDHGLALEICGRDRDASIARRRGRLLLQQASREDAIVADQISSLWWSWSSDDGERDEGPLSCTDSLIEASRRLRMARGVRVSTDFWSDVVTNSWPDRKSKKALLTIKHFLAEAPWNKRNSISTFARSYGDVEDLGTAQNHLLALVTGEVSENISYSAHALRLDASLAAGDPKAATTCLETLQQLAKRMPPEAERFGLLLAEAKIALRRGEPGEARCCWERARTFLEQPTIGPPASWFFEAYFQLADGRVLPAAKVLREVRRFWPSLPCYKRSEYHRLAAWALATLDDMVQGRLAWAQAEAYDRRFATVAPYERKLWNELYNVGSSFAVTANEVSSAEDALWGPVVDRPYVLVRGPDVALRELPPDAKPDSKPEVLGPVEPLHLRNRPATVAELRAFCAASGTPLPWYYRVQNPDAADYEWARFVPYALAKRLAEHLEEGLPGTLGWQALLDDPAWRLSIPTKPTPLPPVATIDDWVEQSPAWLALAQNLLRSGEIAPGDLPLVRALLCADPVSALDKWRIVEAARRVGLKALPPRLSALIGIAAARRVPSPLAVGVLARLERDWRSIAHLAGITEVTPDAVWLRPEIRKPHKTFGTIEHMGGVGALVRQGTPVPCLLVPDACAWADVLVWPSRLFDPTWYREEAPPWP